MTTTEQLAQFSISKLLLELAFSIKKLKTEKSNNLTFTRTNNSVNSISILSNFSCMCLNPNIFSNLNANCSNLLDLRNLHEQVKEAFCYQKLF